MPAFSLGAFAKPGRLRAGLAMAQEIEERGFAGVYCSTASNGFAFCNSLLHVTARIPLGTAITNIYARNPVELGQAAAHLHEVGEGRFSLGLGVAHANFNAVLGVTVGPPLRDMRAYVGRMRAAQATNGPLPPIRLAALRPKMMALAAEIAEGVVFSSLTRARATELLARAGVAGRDDFLATIGMRVCLNDDPAAAEAAAREAMMTHAVLQNYRDVWRSFGFAAEMDAVEARLAAGERAAVPAMLPAALVSEIVLFGDRNAIRRGVERWLAAGIQPVLAPLYQAPTTEEAIAGYRAVMDAWA
jgi:alkanesulfonate monooxygenase SsuD/methylene tetrahydromethanopterin reductase-like flavin-dependent oxidoreductase (luciferase family)